MEETSFEVYQGSEVKKLIELIKFAMQVSPKLLSNSLRNCSFHSVSKNDIP